MLNSLINKTVSLIFVLSPFLGLYSFGVNGLSIVDMLFIFLNIFGIIYLSVNRKEISIMLIFILFSISQLFLVLALGFDVNIEIVLPRMIKFYNLILFFILFNKVLISNYTFKYMRIAAVLFALALLFQWLSFHLFNYIVLFELPFFPYINEHLNSVDFTKVLENDFRPGSVFSEPAHYVQYIIFTYFFLGLKKGDSIVNLFPYLSVILTKSTTGIVFLLFIAFQFLKEKSLTLVYILILAVLFFLILDYDSIYSIDAISRLFANDNIAITGRLFAGMESFLGLPEVLTWVGAGFNNYEKFTYSSGLFFVLHSFGWFGLILIILYFLNTIKNFKKTRYFIAFCVLLSLFSPVLFSIYIVHFLLILKILKKENS